MVTAQVEVLIVLGKDTIHPDAKILDVRIPLAFFLLKLQRKQTIHLKDMATNPSATGARQATNGLQEMMQCC